MGALHWRRSQQDWKVVFYGPECQGGGEDVMTHEKTSLVTVRQCGFRMQQNKDKWSRSKCYVLRVLELGWTAGGIEGLVSLQERLEAAVGGQGNNDGNSEQHKFKVPEEIRDMAAAKVLTARGKMMKINAKGASDCLVLDMLQELPSNPCTESHTGLGKDAVENVGPQRRGQFYVWFSTRSLMRSW